MKNTTKVALILSLITGGCATTVLHNQGTGNTITNSASPNGSVAGTPQTTGQRD